MRRLLVVLLFLLPSLAEGQAAGGSAISGGTAGIGSAQMIYLSTSQTGGTLACPNTSVGTSVTCSIWYTVVSGTSVSLTSVGNPTGTNAADFAQVNSCGTLPHTFTTGSGCSITVT